MDKIKRSEILVFLGVVFFFIALYFFTNFLIKNNLQDTLVYGYWHYLWIGVGAFIGVALHELGHAVFCHIVGIKVYEIKYYNHDQSEDAPDGYVIHEVPKNLLQALMITIGPIFLVGLFSVITFFIALLLKWEEIDFFLAWTFIGYGMFFGLFPSTWDMATVFREVNKRVKQNFLVCLFYPLLAVLYVLSFFWIKVILVVLILIGFLNDTNITFG